VKRTWSQDQRGSQEGAPSKRPRFSAFFATPEVPDENQVVEIGLLIRKYWVGLLIGKKGATIRELTQKSNAKMNFGDDDVEFDQELFHVMAVSGTRDQVKKASIAIADKLAEVNQSEDYKLVFLVPDMYCGMFIGKKGANVKKMKGDSGGQLWIKLSQNPIKLPGVSEATTCSIFGPKDGVVKAIDVAAVILGDISASMQQNMKKEQEMQPPSYAGGFGTSLGEPPSYGGGFRGDFNGRGGGLGRGGDVRYGGGFGRGGDNFGSGGDFGGYRGRGSDSYGMGGVTGGYGRGDGDRDYRPGGGIGRGNLGGSGGFGAGGRGSGGDGGFGAGSRGSGGSGGFGAGGRGSGGRGGFGTGGPGNGGSGGFGAGGRGSGGRGGFGAGGRGTGGGFGAGGRGSFSNRRGGWDGGRASRGRGGWRGSRRN